MFRSLVVALFCASLSACSGIGDVFMSVPAKVNKAFPPNTEVRVAEESLRSLLQSDAAATASFEQQLASRMELRALTCAQGLTVGRFDSVDKIKSYAINRECLTDQDTLLLQLLGIRQIGFRLSQPALRPLVPLGATATVPTAGGPDISGVYAASAAGVAVFTGGRGELLSVEIPGGKKIATLPAMSNGVQGVLVSPNGRVAAVRSGYNSILFIDTETGAKLWDAKEIKQFHAWLPEVSAGLASDTKTGALALIDFQAGTFTAHPVALRDPAWALQVSKTPSRVLVGSGRTLSLIEHTRNGLVKGVTVKEFQLKQGQGVGYSSAALMLDGKSVVFMSGRVFTTIDLDSGAETSWPTGDLLSSRFAKLSESTLLVETNERDSNSLKTVVLDVAKGTVAPVLDGEAGSGSLAELAGRTGFVRRGYQGLWLGDSVKTGDPATLESLVAAANLARQLARLEAETPDGGRSAMPGSEMMPNIILPTVSGTSSGQDTVLKGLARGARIEAVGVYQGAGGVADRTGRKVGTVEVRVRRGKGLILVLSSYEPVRWKLVPEPGASVLAVLLSGYYQSEVVGAGNARVTMSGSNYAYTAGSAEFNVLNRQTAVYTGKGIDTFQGKYEGSTFSVGE